MNYFIFDRDRSFTGAFANWRSNPNTGEIRGASVYFAAADSSAPPATLPPAAWSRPWTAIPRPRAAGKTPPSTGWRWGSLGDQNAVRPARAQL